MDIWNAIAAIAAVIVVPVTILATQKWGTRRAQISVSVESTPILPRSGHNLLAVTFNDISVDSPHLVVVTIRNVGPKDISSQMFDRGLPIEVVFDTTFYGVTESAGATHTVSPAIGAEGADAKVQIFPNLLKKGGEWSFSAVASGPVEVIVNAPLVDTKVVRIVPARDSDLTLGVSMLGVSMEIPIPRKEVQK